MTLSAVRIFVASVRQPQNEVVRAGDSLGVFKIRVPCRNCLYDSTGRYCCVLLGSIMPAIRRIRRWWNLLLQVFSILLSGCSLSLPESVTGRGFWWHRRQCPGASVHHSHLRAEPLKGWGLSFSVKALKQLSLFDPSNIWVSLSELPNSWASLTNHLKSRASPGDRWCSRGNGTVGGRIGHPKPC